MVNISSRRLAVGDSVELICEEMGEVVEGVPTANEVVLLAEKLNLDLPLFTTCAKVSSSCDCNLGHL